MGGVSPPFIFRAQRGRRTNFNAVGTNERSEDGRKPVCPAGTNERSEDGRKPVCPAGTNERSEDGRKPVSPAGKIERSEYWKGVALSV